MDRTMEHAKPQPDVVSRPFNINVANEAQLITLPGIEPVIARRIDAARNLHGCFKDWAELSSSVEGIGQKTVADIAASCLAVVRPLWFFDPVLDLPEDLAAHCLSFLDARSLLITVWRVNHAWRDAIDGGLPAVWRDMSLREQLSAAQLAEVARRSHGRIFLLDGQVLEDGMQVIHSFSGLRVLRTSTPPNSGCSVSPVLSCFPLLEALTVNHETVPVVIPPLQALKAIRCSRCHSINGLHNLPALTKLDINATALQEGDAWPASLRDVVIRNYPKYDPGVVDRIAALQQPVSIDSDWWFVWSDIHSLPPDNLSFLASFSTLQRLVTDLPHRFISPFFSYLSAMATSSLRELDIRSGAITDERLQRLSSLTNLQTVSLHCSGEMTSEGLRHVCELPALTSLCLNCCSSVTDYSHVGRCSHLRELRITHHSCVDVRAVTQLQHLENLELCFHDIPHDLIRDLCTMSSLRHLSVCGIYCEPSMPATVFASLPTLTALESIRVPQVHPVGQLVELVDYLVGIPMLRRIELHEENKVDAQDEARLREALPRLETISWY